MGIMVNLYHSLIHAFFFIFMSYIYIIIYVIVGGSCYGLNYMTYAIRTPQMPNATGVRRPCVTLDTYVPPPTINPTTVAPHCDQASPVVCSFTAVIMAFLVLFFIKFINAYD